MKLSKLLRILIEYLEEHGDIDIYFQYGGGKCLDEFEEMEFNIEKLKNKKILAFAPISVNVRSDVELLQILLDNIGKLVTGLCHLALELYKKSVITLEEYNKLRDIIRTGKHPKYYWKPGLKEPRIKYLETLIRNRKMRRNE